ncbi:outer membrane protein OmpA-like peptidoglycan-associated protein [Sphingomonas zeicaulis]|uniref:OmpA family protein n=1 Tax=Sphingomonas zeicaulis TaxID=1632740 RepID=UPI003D25959E
MRFTLLASAIALVTVPVTAIQAQEQATRSPSDFVCELTGEDCAAEPAAEAEAPAAPGPAATTTTGGRAARVAGDSRGFVLAKPVDPNAAARPTPKPAPVRVVTNRPKPTMAPGGGTVQPRVDLRLGFSTGSSMLVGSELMEVKSFAAALKSPRLAGRRVRIEGHTDSVGSRASNLTLSRERAYAVRQTLIAEGVSADRIEAAGYGFDRPLPGQLASAGANRRVEAVLVN